MPTVGIVIPVYNCRQYLGECLDSLMAQTFRDFHVYIIDDGSSDGSQQIAREYCGRDSRFEFIQTDHGGVSRARNLGIDLCQEKYIGFVDADDALQPWALETLLSIMQRTGSQVCIGGLDVAERFGALSPVGDKAEVMSYSEAIEKGLYQSIIINSPCGMLLERDLLGDNVRFREGTRYEDLDAFYRFYERADRIAWLPEKLYFYRQTGGSFMHQWSEARLDVLDVTDRLLHYMEKRHPELGAAARDRRFSAHYDMLIQMLKNDVRNQKAFEKCLSVIKKERFHELGNPKVRLKNKLGALATFGGVRFIRFLAKFLKK